MDVSKIDPRDPGTVERTETKMVPLPKLHDMPLTLGDSGPGGGPAFMPDAKMGQFYWKLHRAEDINVPAEKLDPEHAEFDLAAAQLAEYKRDDDTKPEDDRCLLEVPQSVLDAIATVRKYFAEQVYKTLAGAK